MDEYPRSVGSPKQMYINSYDELWDVFQETCGVSTVFTSVGSYPRIAFHNNKQKPVTIKVGNIFTDFDSERKPENALRDLRNMTNFLLDHNIPFLNAYSGSKGFANYIILEPTRYKYQIMNGSCEALKQMVHGVHLFFKNGFRNDTVTSKKPSGEIIPKWYMPTMDPLVMKDPKRLCRMMYSPHVNRNGKINGRHCFPLTLEQSLDWSINDIIQYSYNPKFIIPDIIGERRTLTELTKYLGINIKEASYNVGFSPTNKGDITKITEDETQLLLFGLEDIKPCIVNQLKSINPPHDIRVAFACYMKRVGQNMMEAEQHYVNVAKHFGYVDLHNSDERLQQFKSLYNNPSYKSEPRCGKLKSWGYCIGDTCPRYHKKWRN
jgi:hypothetical protein